MVRNIHLQENLQRAAITAASSIDLLLTLDRTKIESVGVPAMGKFLEKLQVYRSIGDYESGKKLFDSYSQFDDKWLKWREIIIAKQKPKTMMIQANTLIEGIQNK